MSAADHLSPALKPCPFCGGEMLDDAIIDHNEGVAYTESNVVVCRACGAEAAPGPSAEQAIANWNRRAPAVAVPSSSALAPERIAEIRARLDGVKTAPWAADTTEPHDMVIWGTRPADMPADDPEDDDLLIMNMGEPIARVGDPCGSVAEAGFIAHAPTDVADLLADRERLERRVGELETRDAENESLFRWLLGEEGEFPESAPGRRYNFRSELRRRLAARATPEPTNG